jgi:plastocyanin
MEENNINSKNTTLLITGGLLMVILIIGAVFIVSSRQNQNPSVAGTGEELTDLSNSEVAGMADSAPEENVVQNINIEMEAGSFYYAPNEIRVKEGDTVTVVLTAKDMMHDFNIDELGVKIPIVKAGETATAEFVASQKGEFEYYCSVGQHRANGQVGKLIVE